MAKTKQTGSSTSAAQRRQQAREQRPGGNQNIQAQQTRRIANKRKTKQSIWQSPWTLIGIIVVLVALVVGIFFYLSNQSNQSNATAASNAFKTITHIDPKLLTTVGNGGSDVKNQMVPVKGGPPLTGSTGKPEFFYEGADYCPFCAAQRWAVIASLSRFGTFSPLAQNQSGEQSISTYTFRGATYTSQYIDFVGIETEDNNGQPLQALTPAQQALVSTYDSPPYVSASSKGGIPFIDIANMYVSSGAYYSPTILLNLSHQDIANQVTDTTTDVSKGMLGSANYLTAAICQATHNQPANVCTTGPIPSIEQSLPKVTASSNGPQLALAGGLPDMITRRD